MIDDLLDPLALLLVSAAIYGVYMLLICLILGGHYHGDD